MIELDNDVVDAEADERGEQMLDGLDRAVFQRQARRVLNAAKVRDDCGNLEPPKVGPPEANAVVGRGRLERQRHLLTGVESDSGAGYGPLEGAL